MPKRKSFVGCPVLFTHWDPDMYPDGHLPLVAELVLHILAHGEVWLKEVDLFLNPRVSEYLSDPIGFQQFSSLVETKRVKILIPDESRDLDDPISHPILSTAMEIVTRKRPLKSNPWIMTEKDRRLCEALDSLLVANGGLKKNGVVRHRVSPPTDRNTFAETLIDVLSCPDMRWRQRDQFRGIDEPVAQEFLKLATNHELALDLLRKGGITPNATNGFYRSLLYQCADYLFPEREKEAQRQAIKNLGQSAYVHCELNREKAMGIYFGERIAELPPTEKRIQTNEPLVRIEVVPTRKGILIPVASNIGEVVSAVLEECDSSMRGFWAVAGNTSAPEVEFFVAWERVAEAFAKHSVDSRAGELSNRTTGLWKVGEFIVNGAEMLNEGSKQVGYKFIPDLSSHPLANALHLGVTSIAAFGRPTMEYIRRGQADAQKGAIQQVLLSGATVRSGLVGPADNSDPEPQCQSSA